MNRISQKIRILEHLQAGRKITPQEALDLYRCFRLAAVIHTLKNEGYPIVSETKTNGDTHWAEYSMAAFDISRIM